jgi:hypothetical protein
MGNAGEENICDNGVTNYGRRYITQVFDWELDIEVDIYNIIPAKKPLPLPQPQPLPPS